MNQKETLRRVFESGKELTEKQISATYKIASPRSVISQLRRVDGLAIYANRRVNSKGVETTKYRLGTPSKSIVAAGFRAMSAGI